MARPSPGGMGGPEEQPLPQRGPLPPKSNLRGGQYGLTATRLECKGVFEYQTSPSPPSTCHAGVSDCKEKSPPSLMVCSSAEGAATQNKYK